MGGGGEGKKDPGIKVTHKPNDFIGYQFDVSNQSLSSFKGLNYHNFTFFIITNFKTDRYLTNFQEHLLGILRLTKYTTSFQNFFPR